MSPDFAHYRYKTRHKKKGWVLLFALASAATFLVLGSRWHWFDEVGRLFRRQVEAVSPAELWNNRLYDELITRCRTALKQNPLDHASLAYLGFSAFYRAVSTNAVEDKIPYLDEAVISLRKASILHEAKWKPEIDYVLGKAYYHKGKYYYDLSVRYLSRALEQKFASDDIYDYLGLAYSQMGFLNRGLEALLKALSANPTDILLFTIGQIYFQLDRIPDAEEYLIRAVNKTDDPAVEKKSRFILGQIYFDRREYLKSEQEYQKILVLDPDSADGHFYLGEVYQKLNDPVRARAEWRKTLIIDPAHYGAKLRYYR